MKVKGTILSSAQKFVKKNYEERYQEWLNKLPQESKVIYESSIMATEWYDIKESLIIPTEKIAEIFFDGDVYKAGWQMGRYSAEVGLKGIYKVFVLISTPQFMMSRGGKILSSFYNPSVLKVGAERQKGVDIHVTDFENSSEITEGRIGGWMEKALEICGVKKIRIELTKSLAKGDDLTIYQVNWE